MLNIKNLLEKRAPSPNSIAARDDTSNATVNGDFHKDIPFIDEGLDNEGNVLSPTKQTHESDSSQNKETLQEADFFIENVGKAAKPLNLSLPK